MHFFIDIPGKWHHAENQNCSTIWNSVTQGLSGVCRMWIRNQPTYIMQRTKYLGLCHGILKVLFFVDHVPSNSGSLCFSWSANKPAPVLLSPLDVRTSIIDYRTSLPHQWATGPLFVSFLVRQNSCFMLKLHTAFKRKRLTFKENAKYDIRYLKGGVHTRKSIICL